MSSGSEQHRQEAVEARTQQIGREVFAHIDTSRPSPLKRQWWDELLMEWSMADPWLKVQLFRFIDVLPALQSAEAVDQHLRAYFSPLVGTQHEYPLLVRLGAHLAEPGTLRGRLVARLIRQNVIRLARRFIAGSEPAEVIEAAARMRRAGMTFTLDLLGEATVSETEADAYLEQYLELLDRLAAAAATWDEVPLLDRDPLGPLPRINLSVKLSALYSQFDPAAPDGAWRAAGRRLRQLFLAARRHGALVNVDMEQYVYKELTLALFCRLLMEPELRDWPDVGIAIQAYLPDTAADLERLLDWAQGRQTPVWVRLVKGAYWDYETVVARQQHWPVPVFTQKWQSDASFERCTWFLLENHRWLRPAFASHNVRSLAHAAAVAEQLGLEPTAYEFQMLYGMARSLQRALVKRGHRLRLYTPFGKLLPGMAYLVRRLLENTSNTSFLRATFAERQSVEKLLERPGRAGVAAACGAASAAGPADAVAATAGARAAPAADSGHPQHAPPTPFVNEPLTDFSRPANRQRMSQALAAVRQQFGRQYPMWIAGRAVTGSQWLDSVNPADYRTVVGRVACGTVEQADAAVAAAVRAWPEWRARPIRERAEVLFAVAAELRRRRFELAAWTVYECGKQWREADADVAEAIDFCQYYGRAMLELAGPRQRNRPGEQNCYFYAPRGLCAVIAPWNFPLAILCGMTVGPLVAGNAVVMKPAEQSSVVAAVFADILGRLDLPAGTVNFLPGIGEQVGRRLVEHPEVAVVSFTGSRAVGLEINRLAAEPRPGQRHVKHVVAEMGGKNAIIIDDDADLDEAVTGVVASAFGYQGQKCSACSRVIALAGVYDSFLSRLRQAVASLTIGPPEEPGNRIGPVIDREAFERLRRAIDRAKQEATCVYAGDASHLADTGYYIAPHLFADVAPESFLAQTELFGPVLAVLKAQDLEQALQIANGTDYALTGGIYSRNPDSVARARQCFDVGNLYINRKITGALVDLQPFGGFKLSGMGAKAGGPDYLKQFLIARTITENTMRRGFAPEQQ